MADKFPDRGNFIIPSSLIDEHEWMSDAFIDGPTGILCTVEYPPVDSECPNCLFDPGTGRSANIYRAGGPYPFPDHTLCPYCGGAGRSTAIPTDSLRMRVYFGGMEVNAAMKQFTDLSNIDAPAGLVFVIGYMNDLPKFERANAIRINTTQAIEELKYSRFSECIPWGFRKTRYFACMLKRG